MNVTVFLAACTLVRVPMPPKGSGKDKAAQNPNNVTESKIHCDEAAGHLKTGNHGKALHAYSMVSKWWGIGVLTLIYPVLARWSFGMWTCFQYLTGRPGR